MRGKRLVQGRCTVGSIRDANRGPRAIGSVNPTTPPSPLNGADNAVADPGVWIRGVKFKKFRPKRPILSGRLTMLQMFQFKRSYSQSIHFGAYFDIDFGISNSL